MNIFDESEEPAEAILISIKVEKGKIRQRDGKPLPKLVEGSYGHLMMPKGATLLNAPYHEAKMLDGGSPLLVAVWTESAPLEIRKRLYVPDIRQSKSEWGEAGVLSESSGFGYEPLPSFQRDGWSFVEVLLREPLFIEFTGATTRSLRSATCYVSALDNEEYAKDRATHFYPRFSNRFVWRMQEMRN